ncbi:hypothetical protein JFN94_25850 [Burkholderia anthina]|uniref:Uncharacterized protein n=1 Tax=Burkholderia anthina TaxID=179879 RepID=A0A7T7AJC2_9BURK|nr:hypothetical protein [Burkholderia anthina]QQK04755.1 hypothetical protein JFN94_25850 [Burkholderia anthina]
MTDLPSFGSPMGAGFFGGTFLLDSVYYAMVVAPKSAERSDVVVADATAMAQATSYADGHANTAALASSGEGLASAITGLVIGEQGDLYIPSRDELATIFSNLLAFPGSALAIGAEQGFNEVPYLTSTALGPDLLWNQNPFLGYQCQDDKRDSILVRPIWRIAIDGAGGA